MINAGPGTTASNHTAPLHLHIAATRVTLMTLTHALTMTVAVTRAIVVAKRREFGQTREQIAHVAVGTVRR